MFKERPMLFSPPMAIAINEGRKTQTRRIIKDQKKFQECYDFFNCDNYGCAELQVSEYDRGFGLYMGCSEYPDEGSEFWKSPYGKIGDRLWVKENWRTTSTYDCVAPRNLPKDASIEYIATDEPVLSGKIRPNIFMCRWMSRFILELTDIRVQRVQAISEEDAEAEGCISTAKVNEAGDDYYGEYPSELYMRVWNEINDNWDENPWIWALTFKRI